MWTSEKKLPDLRKILNDWQSQEKKIGENSRMYQKNLLAIKRRQKARSKSKSPAPPLEFPATPTHSPKSKSPAPPLEFPATPTHSPKSKSPAPPLEFPATPKYSPKLNLPATQKHSPSQQGTSSQKYHDSVCVNKKLLLKSTKCVCDFLQRILNCETLPCRHVVTQMDKTIQNDLSNHKNIIKDTETLLRKANILQKASTISILGSRCK